MTDTEAKKVADLLKTGKQYKQGHYQQGYESFEFVEKDNLFKYTREETGLDWFNPLVTKALLTEKEFLVKMTDNFNYEEFINNLI